MTDFTDHHATPVHSIRAFCVQCMAYDYAEVAKCTAPKCPLFPYRMGKRPAKGSKCISTTEAIKISRRSGS